MGYVFCSGLVASCHRSAHKLISSPAFDRAMAEYCLTEQCAALSAWAREGAIERDMSDEVAIPRSSKKTIEEKKPKKETKNEKEAKKEKDAKKAMQKWLAEADRTPMSAPEIAACANLFGHTTDHPDNIIAAAITDHLSKPSPSMAVKADTHKKVVSLAGSTRFWSALVEAHPDVVPIMRLARDNLKERL